MKDFTSIFGQLWRRAYAPVRTNRVHPNFDLGTNEPRNNTKNSALAIAIVGVMGLIGGFFILFIRPYDFLFKWKVILSEGGEIFELWRTPPIDLYLRVYLWNITNKEAYMNGTDHKLKMVEVGPYVYKEMMSHDNVTFNDNGTVTAVPRHPLVWMPELSEGRKEDDLLVMPNVALLSIAHVVAGQSYFTRLGLNLLVRQTGAEPLIQMTAKEFMFGYKSTLMTLGNRFMPGWIYFDKLGLIDRMYDFDGDYETVYTGTNDVAHTGLIDTYRGSSKIPQWDSPCGDVQGASDGTKFAGFLHQNDTLLFFRKSMCRAKRLINVGTTVRSGLDGFIYNFEPNADDNGFHMSENRCFCKIGTNCLPPGLLDVHGCYYGFPIALSYPHFLDANPIVGSKVVGHEPDPDKHRSYFIVQPYSGLPLDLAVRYQINMALGDIKNIANCERFDNLYLPLLWTETRMYGLPEMLAARFRLYLNVLPIVERAIMYASFILGTIFAISAIYRFIRSKSHAKVYDSTWIEDDFGTNLANKLNTYVPERRNGMTIKELEVYHNSLVAPLNQEIDIIEDDV